ncbi:type II toxin-antitoxin system RelB/DinJ family antitoxin [bacterium]|nr:type II toxin-antitoxin system RelB/DinJ family antitoxin [bacterium]
MVRTTTIQARIDPEVKRNAQAILGKLNISMSEAISLYLTQVALHKGIPFKIKIPNALTSKALTKSEAGEELHEIDSIDGLFEELDS